MSRYTLEQLNKAQEEARFWATMNTLIEVGRRFDIDVALEMSSNYSGFKICIGQDKSIEYSYQTDAADLQQIRMEVLEVLIP